ncbi:hypothetical protein [Aquimarina latercula]|uniref:hypothetical protein n=1 Tax=Aquimarina latercula TaxID=987 RepID=UPI00041203B8|nr:hypothetical protein [Aquimarina latercula]
MSRLSLDAFKAKAQTSQSEELENLTGGILGACHPSDAEMIAEGYSNLLQTLHDKIEDLLK